MTIHYVISRQRSDDQTLIINPSAAKAVDSIGESCPNTEKSYSFKYDSNVLSKHLNQYSPPRMIYQRNV